MSFFSLTLILFLIMDPVGNIAPYLSMTEHLTSSRHRRVIIREMLIALAVMLAFNFLGEFIFALLQISDTTVRLSSGLILFLFAIRILFPGLTNPRSDLPKEEPFIIPLAIPLIAGPSLLATIMLFAYTVPSVATMVLAIVFAWLAAFLILYFSPAIRRALGDNGLMACERLMGMILVLLAIQRFMEGIQTFIQTYNLG